MIWYCYALISDCGRYTYIGKTNDLHRRLRQHNGEISGGARYTRRGRPWRHFVIVSGFPTNSMACCFEWAWKKKRKRGKMGVYNALERVCNKDRWTRKCPPASTMPLSLVGLDDINIKLPYWVTITNKYEEECSGAESG
jgi:predicted GIY-YIG superfamily endonuclease